MRIPQDMLGMSEKWIINLSERLHRSKREGRMP